MNTVKNSTLYITGAGVSADSGIPTFRGKDGFWTIGSVNYTPQEMATRAMYEDKPGDFLLWYYKRFVKYRHIKPNVVHKWLSTKKLITQKNDGLDGKAGNRIYIPIHGRLDKVTLFHDQGIKVDLIDAPWEQISLKSLDSDNDNTLTKVLLELFRISTKSLKPERMHSLKPFVLLFDEYYTEIYRMSEAEKWINEAKRIIFIGTSFSVNITSIALNLAIQNNSKIEVVDPEPIDLGIKNIIYHKMTANEYVKKVHNFTCN